MSLSDNGIVYTGRLHALRVGVRDQPARPGRAHHQLRPVSPADLRQDRTVLADPEEVAARPPDPGHHRRTQRPTRQFRGYYNHHRPHRALRGATPAEAFAATAQGPARRPAAAGTGIRHPPHRRGEIGQPATSRPTSQRRTALGRPRMRQHPRRRPHRHLQRHHPRPRTSPPTPPADTNPATKPPEPTAPANPNRHHKCQRCPET